MCNPATHTVHSCSQCGKDNGLDHCTSHCSHHIPQAVKVDRYTEREYIAQLQKAAILGVDATFDYIVTCLVESGEDYGMAREYVQSLCDRYVD